MRILYDLFFLTFSILYIPYLIVKRKAHRDLLQRFSFLPTEATRLEKPVWIHAVSVGEAALAGELSAMIKNHFPSLPIVISTTTKTGNEIARKFCGGAVDAVFYFPLDLGIIVSRVVRQVDPRLYVMVETELWPNLLKELRSKEIPIVLANGRISDTSFKNYKKIKFIMKRILGDIDCFCMQSDKDAMRIKQLGAQTEKVHVTGNIKFDEITESGQSDAFRKADLGFNEGDDVIVAGSTHSPEEMTIIDIYGKLKKKRENLKLVLAPRHTDRTDEVGAYIEKSGLKFRRFSRILSGEKENPPREDVVLVDTIGHLKNIYNIATLIFVGGSLAKKGGQNPIEGARWGKAVVFGPHMFNFREVASIFVEGNGAMSVKDAPQLRTALEDLLENPDKRERLAVNAKRIIEENSGAIGKTLERIEEYLR